MKNNKLWVVLVLVAIVVGGWWYFNNGGTLGMPGPGDSSQDSQTNTNDGSATTPTAQATKTYSDATYGFSFAYPAPATLETSGLSTGGFTSTSAKGLIAVYTRYDNVVERFSVNVSKDPGDLGSCMTKPDSKSTTVTINNVPFLMYEVEEQVQGQTVITAVYRLDRNTTCYEIRNVINFPNQNQLTADEVKQRIANVAASRAFADSILQTFKFSQ